MVEEEDWDLRRSAQDFLGGGMIGAIGTTGVALVAMGDSLE